MTDTVQLLIIDPQNDFCDLPASACPEGQAPSLPVPGADADLQRLAGFVDAMAGRLQAITVTLDAHHRLDIAHPGFWRRGDGGQVAPFTPISAAALRAGEFVPRDPQALPRALAYAQALEAGGRYTLMCWPVHCEIGSWGHAVHDAVRAAYNRWELARGRSVHKLLKGSNPWTEHYSALQAEVPDPEDPATLLNQALLARLGEARTLFVAGEAGSHCVRASVEHLVQHLPGGDPARLVLLTDCMSPVAGFEAEQAGFLAGMQRRGVRLATAAEAGDMT
jgi:nicotinamidase/pyrazinamidase